MSVYTARLVQRDGTVVRTLVNANVIRIVDELNGVGEVEVTYPKYDPSSAVGQAADVQVLQRELQILRDGTVIAWCVPVHKKASSARGDITLTALGVSWYFTRRFIDRQITEQLTNPDFEAGLTGWTAVNCTATVVTSPTRLGAQAVRLTQTVTGADAYLKQTLPAETAGATPLGHVLAGSYYLESINGPALGVRGLYIQGVNTGGQLVADYKDLDEQSDRNQWRREQVTYDIGATDTATVEVRLYCPNGSIVWDAIHLVHPEGYALASPGKYAAVIAGELVLDAQTAPGKSALNIGVSTPATGPFVQFPFGWAYVDHTPLMRAVNDELAPLGFDWSIQLMATTKTFTTHVPRKGTDRTATTTLRLGVNVASYDFDEDGTAVDSYVVMHDASTGSARDEAIAVDTAQLGGLVLQGMYTAPAKTTVNSLVPFAADKLARGKRLVRLPTVTTHQGAGDLVGLLVTGDVVTVVIDDGAVQVNANYRIVRRELDPRTETLKLTLNEDFGVRGGIQGPALAGAVAGIGTRVLDIERSTSPPRRPAIEERPTFTYPGALAVATSPEYPVRTGGPLVQVDLTLVTAGSTATTVQVFRNGTQVGADISIAAAVTSMRAYYGANVMKSGDRLKVRVLTVGTGAADLTVTPLMKS